MFKSAVAISLTVCVAVFMFSCNKKCKSLPNSTGGEVISLYDFGDCYIYATVDTSLIISTDSAFSAFKTARFIHCNSAAVPAINFSNQTLLGYRTEIQACNTGTHRSIAIDTVAKTYTYSMKVTRCKGCNTQLGSNNFVLGPKIPAGYQVLFDVKID